MRLTSILQIASVLTLWCAAAIPAYADVVALDGAVVVTDGHARSTDDNKRDNNKRITTGRDDKVIIYNGNSSGKNGAVIMKDGKVVEAREGDNNLGNGNNINVDQGRVNGSVGNVQIKN